jgi:hypothetical protein
MIFNDKAHHGGTSFGAEMTWGPLSIANGNQSAEKQADRSQVILGGFADQVPFIIQLESGCWRRCCMIGGAMRDESKS